MLTAEVFVPQGVIGILTAWFGLPAGRQAGVRMRYRSPRRWSEASRALWNENRSALWFSKKDYSRLLAEEEEI